MDEFTKALAIFFVFYFILLISTTPEPIVSDEGDHMMDSFFFYNLFRDFFTNPKLILNLPDYVYRFYTFYPALYIVYYPPLFASLTTLSFMVLGPSMLSTRLITIIFSIASLGVFYLIGKRLYDRKTSFLATLILSFAPFYFIFSNIAMLEVPLLFFTFLSILFFLKGLEENKNYFYLMGLSLGVGALIKYSIFSLGPGIFFYLIYKKAFFKNFKELFLSALIALLIFTPYVLIVNHFNGMDYTLWVLGRKADECYDICPPKSRLATLYYYPFFLFFEVFPLVFLLPIAYFIWHRKLENSDIFLLFLVFFYFLFFTILSNKTPKYIMVTIPLFSLLFVSALKRLKKGTAVLFVSVFLAQFIISIFFPPYRATETSTILSFDSQKPASYLANNIEPQANVFLIGSFYEDGLIFNFASLNNFQNHVLRWRDCVFENISSEKFSDFIHKNNIQFVVTDDIAKEQYKQSRKFLDDNFKQVYSGGNMLIYENQDLQIMPLNEICDFVCKINKTVCRKID
ncbi:hypothetical protein A3K63_00895 [Candidatus Micrarchaeota archaeon RBG_16_49_10]|nr:MAG: hypothetical protein A3K63_00895 [Candidatus Micrarchaeota archaeon RBG_16_49_10]